MAIPHAASAEAIDVRPYGEDIGNHRTATLLKTESLEVIRLVLPAGKSIPSHQTAGDLTLQCLEGSVVLRVADTDIELHGGQLIYLTGSTPHALRAVDPSSLLLTLRLAPPKTV